MSTTAAVARRPTDGSFYSILTPEQRSQLATLGVALDYQPGERLIREGANATHVVIILRGWAKATSYYQEDREDVTMLRIVGPGDLAGVEAGIQPIYANHRWNETVVTVTTSRALTIPGPLFNSCMATQPMIGLALSRVLLWQLREGNRRQALRAKATAAERLANVLLGLADRYGTAGPDGSVDIAPRLTQSELASLAGMSLASVSRALLEWRAASIVKSGYRELTICDTRRLREICGKVD